MGEIKTKKIKTPLVFIGDIQKLCLKPLSQKSKPQENTLGLWQTPFYQPDALFIRVCNISAVGCRYRELIVFCVSPNKRATWSRSILKL